MTMNLRSALEIDLGWTWRDVLGAFTAADNNRLHFRQELNDGADVHQANGVWRASDQALLSGRSVVLHLNALKESLFGNEATIRFDTIRILAIVNKSAENAAHLAIGGAGLNEWFAPFGAAGHSVRVMSGSPLVSAHLRGGWLVRPDAEALKLTAMGGRVVFDIAIVGTLAPTP